MPLLSATTPFGVVLLSSVKRSLLSCWLASTRMSYDTDA